MLPLPDLTCGAPRLPEVFAPTQAEADVDWVMGWNCPSIHRGGGGACGIQAYHLLNNVCANLRRLPHAVQAQWLHDAADSGLRVEQRSAVGLASALCGMSVKSVRDIVHRDPPRQAETRREGLPASSSAAACVLNASRLPAACAPAPGCIGRSNTAMDAASTSSLEAMLANTYSGVQSARHSWQEGPWSPCSSEDAGIAMRVASLCTMVVAGGFPHDLFPKLINLLDSHFPGAFGQVNHSVDFVQRFRKSLLRTIHHQQTLSLHGIIPALNLASDFARSWDSVTPLSGEPLLICVVLITDSVGGLQPLCLDMCPMTRDVEPVQRVAPPVSDDACLAELATLADRTGTAASKFALGYHRPEKVGDKLLQVERAYQLDSEEARARKAQDVADGAFIGPGTNDNIVRYLNNAQGLVPELNPGQMCVWHGVVNALKHSDRLEEHPESGMVVLYYRLARKFRQVAAYGEGQKVMRAVAKHLGKDWVRPVAPQEGGTRTVLYESSRVPPCILRDFQVAVIGFLALEQAHHEAHLYAKAKKMREIGAALTDPQTLIFMCARFDFRRPVVEYANLAQVVAESGFEKIKEEHRVLERQQGCINGLQAALGLCRTSSLLFGFAGRNVTLSGSQATCQGASKLTTKGIWHILHLLAHRSGLLAAYPTMAPRLIEVLVKFSFFGVPLGYQPPQPGKLGNKRGWAPTLFDNRRKLERREARGGGGAVTKRERQTAMRYHRQECHHDMLGVCQRALTVCKRDRQLFRSRVMFYDAPAEPEQRFTRKVAQPARTRTSRPSRDERGCIGRAPLHTAVRSEESSEASEAAASEGSTDGTLSEPEEQTSDSDLDQATAVQVPHKSIGKEQQERLVATLAATHSWHAPQLPASLLDERSVLPHEDAPAATWHPDNSAAEFAAVRANISTTGHTQVSGLPSVLWKSARPWRMRFLGIGPVGARRVMCCDALRMEDELRLARRRGQRVPGLRVTTRRRVLEDAADAFHHFALLDLGPVCSRLSATPRGKEDVVRRLHKHFARPGGVLATRAWVPQTSGTAPVEATQIVTQDDFVEQYFRLKTLVREIVSDADAGRPPRFSSAAPGRINEASLLYHVVSLP